MNHVLPTSRLILTLLAALALLLIAAACDQSPISITHSPVQPDPDPDPDPQPQPQWELDASFNLASHYVAPSGGPQSSGNLTVTSSEASTVEASFEISLDNGANFLPLNLTGSTATAATIVGHTIHDLPADQSVTIDWNSAGLAATQVASQARLRVTLADGTSQGPNGNGTTTVLSPAFVLDNTQYVNQAPTLRLLDPDGQEVALPGFAQLGYGTWTIELSDPDPYDQLSLSVEFDEPRTVFNTRGTSLYDYLPDIDPPMSGQPLTTTAQGQGHVAVTLTTHPNPNPSGPPMITGPDSFRLSFVVTASDGNATTVQRVVLGGLRKHKLFVAQGDDFMTYINANPSYGTTLVYDSAGNVIANPNRWQVAVSDIAWGITDLEQVDWFDLAYSTGNGWVVYNGDMQQAIDANRNAAIDWLYAQSPPFGTFGGMFDTLEHLANNPVYPHPETDLVWFTSGYFEQYDQWRIESEFVQLFNAQEVEIIQIGGTYLTATLDTLTTQLGGGYNVQIRQ